MNKNADGFYFLYRYSRMCVFPLREQPFIHLKQSNKNRTAEFQHAGLIMSHKTRVNKVR